MKKFRELSEAVKDKFDIGEYDQEGDMAKSDLRSILANAKRIHDMLEDDDNLPEWVQSKITKAEDYISTVANYMEAEMNEEVEQLKELSPATKSSYMVKAKKEVKELKPHTKGEYGDIAKNIIKRREKGIAMAKEEVEQIDEKNVPTSPEKWAQAKAQAKAKFDVYPSAYANGWAAKKYKEMGGGWKSVSEAKEDDLPFTPDKPKKQQVIAGKHGAGYSTARHLARMAMQKQTEKMKKPIKEEEMSKKAQIVKSAMKKKKETADTFQKEPIISKTEVKM